MLNLFKTVPIGERDHFKNEREARKTVLNRAEAQGGSVFLHQEEGNPL